MQRRRRSEEKKVKSRQTFKINILPIYLQDTAITHTEIPVAYFWQKD